ncbi:hypothetical protein [Polaribacter porphyrae]|uniref:Lipoprotein n=1 Tax=Polaribacter porphyrae TaxID=1137780 RepID=A0A2S7WR91_9FLAO|nr:hypothetical protein [Polaribacter porphyrae]PQJ80138.1 hypothetical protein BTO18_13555 [Polaribacter porphyrae]
MRNWILIMLLTLASFTSCKNQKKTSNQLASNYDNTSYVDFEIDAKYLITEVEVDGVKVGDSYKSHSKRLEKIDNKNGKEIFKRFNLLNKDDEKIGFVYINSFDKKSINKIEITSPKYKTDKGIGVGSTFEEVKENYPNSETHGSEIEGRTTLMAGDYHFLLEGVFFNSYQIDESKINPSTKIKMITIRK